LPARSSSSPPNNYPESDLHSGAACRALISVTDVAGEPHASFWDATESDFDAVLNVNLKGLFFITQAFVKHRMASDSGANNKPAGKIINISSVHEELPFPTSLPTAAARRRQNAHAQSLHRACAALGITINSIAPGAIETPINKNLLNDPAKLNSLPENVPLKRLGTPDDVANMAIFLASDDSFYATGTTFFLDGGLTWNYHEQ
jgi:glucose 1-dehydrogenase